MTERETGVGINRVTVSLQSDLRDSVERSLPFPIKQLQSGIARDPDESLRASCLQSAIEEQAPERQYNGAPITSTSVTFERGQSELKRMLPHRAAA